MHDSLYFSEQHLAVREMVRSFARDEVAPVAAEFDESQEFPWDNVKKMADLGLLGIPWSEELGGAGLDTISFMIAIEELARVCASHSIVVSAHTTLGTSPIVNFGNDAQRKKYVPLLASGSVLGGFGLTEPGAVSTSTPSSVTNNVCSNWAVRLPSAVAAVQPSSNTILCCHVPSVIIGSTVNVMPGRMIMLARSS